MFRPVAAFMIVFTGFSCLRIAFFPRLPAAENPEVNLEKLPGIQAIPIGELPEQRSLDWAFSSTRRYALHSAESDQLSPAIHLFLTGVTARREEHLQVALTTHGDPNIEMRHRRVYLTPYDDEYAMGTIGGRDALQSCTVPGGRSGVTQETLARLMSHRPLNLQDPLGLLRRLAGLQSNRAPTCVLTTLISPVSGQKNQLKEYWYQLLQVSTD